MLCKLTGSLCISIEQVYYMKIANFEARVLNDHPEDSGGQDGGIVCVGNAYYFNERMWAFPTHTIPPSCPPLSSG